MTEGRTGCGGMPTREDTTSIRVSQIIASLKKEYQSLLIVVDFWWLNGVSRSIHSTLLL